MRVIDFKTSGYFSWSVILAGIILLPVGLFVAEKNIFIGLLLLLLSLTILSTHYRLKIDFGTKVFHDYVWILGLKLGDKGSYENIEYLFIKKRNVRQTLNLKPAQQSSEKRSTRAT